LFFVLFYVILFYHYELYQLEYYLARSELLFGEGFGLYQGSAGNKSIRDEEGNWVRLMKTIFSNKKALSQAALLALVCVVLFAVFATPSFADEKDTKIIGKKYSFEKNNDYLISKAESFDTTDSGVSTYGKFYIRGDAVLQANTGKTPSLHVNGDSFEFYYTYNDTLLNAAETEWHLVSDGCSKIDGEKLPCKIQKGLILLQTSKDQKTWITTEYIENAFSNTPIQNSAFYKATDIQLINGCYYRVIVAYELSRRVEEANIFQRVVNQQEYQRCAEVYEFYASNDSVKEKAPANAKRFSLGNKTRTKNFAGYYGVQDVVSTDFHYGWELGEFFISGHTSTAKNDDGTIVILKNVGDEVTLWFNLKQNINALNNNPKLAITNDTEWYDQYFETPKMDSGKGVLIIRQRDYENVLHDPVIYVNYLEANATVGTDVKVQFFEEGDYEVALDYQITKDKLFDQSSHYRIFFKFSVRNGNCMVYPLDVKTGAELTNSSMTENGFKLDMAKSRFLDITVKREMLTETIDGLIEDTRFNKTVKDGDVFTEEGIYTITVSNKYTGQLTTKKIYVGTNLLLKAYMTTGLPIKEIKALVDQGATIDEMGVIHVNTQGESENEVNRGTIVGNSQTEAPAAEPIINSTQNSDNSQGENDTTINPLIYAVAGLAAVVVILVIVIAVKSKKKKIVYHFEDQGRGA